MASKALQLFLEEQIGALKKQGVYNVIDPLQSSNGPEIRIEPDAHAPLTGRLR
jgi:glycine C-acetyltransferase